MPRRAGEGFIASALIVLKYAKSSMTCREIVEQAKEDGLLDSLGKTPEKTLHASLSRDIRGKGKRSEFRKDGPGKFILAKSSEHLK